MMVFIVLLFTFLVFTSLKRRDDIIAEGQTLSSNVSYSIRGIAAIEIMLGHIGLDTQNAFLYANRKAGILFVGVFFMLSGYGLIFSLKNKPNYVNSFLKKRFLRIFVPAYIIYIITLFIVLYQEGWNWELSSVLKYIFLGNFVNGNGYRWYVIELIGLYLVFKLLYKRFSIHRANYLFLIISTIFTIGAFALHFGSSWYGSMLCFNVGLFYGEYTKEIDNFFQKKFLKKNILCAFFVLLGIGGFFVFGENFLGNVILRNLASVFWTLWLLSFLQKVSICSRLGVFLGKISYEIYLIHPMVIILLKDISDPFLFSVICITFSLFLAWIFHKISFARLGSARDCTCDRKGVS